MSRKSNPARWLLTLLVLSALFFGAAGQSLARVEAGPKYATALDVIINEIAWSGTQADTNDEWIELYNPTGSDISLTGWSLKAADGTPSISILSGTILAGDYFLLERTDDTTISDITADWIYTGALEDGGEELILYDDLNNPIDTANGNGGGWPAGTGSPNRYSMERIGVFPDADGVWASNNGIIRNGLDAATPTPNPINGTPRQPNSANSPYPPLSIIINEVAWMGTIANPNDEWIELYNPPGGYGNYTFPSGWKLEALDGDPSIPLGGYSIAETGYLILERIDSNVVNDIPIGVTQYVYNSGPLSDSGEALRLLAPDRSVVDTANGDGGAWPAGTLTTANPHGTMERLGTDADSDSQWFTSVVSSTWSGRDAAGNQIHGTPGGGNSPTPTPTATVSPTSTYTPTLTFTPTNTRTPTIPPTLKQIVINEVGWMGTSSSTSADEWIELYNTSGLPISLDGWYLKSWRYNTTTKDFTLNLDIPLEGIITARTSADPANTSGFFLLEKDDDNTVKDIPADQIYTGTLQNTGEIMLLCSQEDMTAQVCNINNKFQVVDYVNATLDTNGNIKPWPAGSSSTYGSMERKNLLDEPTSWFTHTGASPHWGHDANWAGTDPSKNQIKGTPKHENWAWNVTSTPRNTATPTKTYTPVPQPGPVLVINEYLARPGHDWNNDGEVNVYDEFIEVVNAGIVDVNLSGYKLDDYEQDAEGNVINNGFTLPSKTLKPGEIAVFYGSQTGILLGDNGDTVRLLKASNNTIVDANTYPSVKSLDVSTCRFTDAYGDWVPRCFPTPGQKNALYGEFFPPEPGGGATTVCTLPDSTPEEFALAECEEGGLDVWSPEYWDNFPGEGEERWVPEDGDKWLVIYQ